MQSTLQPPAFLTGLLSEPLTGAIAILVALPLSLAVPLTVALCFSVSPNALWSMQPELGSLSE
jgi:hypothetical protein